MPNWCATRLYCNPKSGATVGEVKQAMETTGFNELLAHGVHTARALFLLVFSGVIRVRGECYGQAPFIWMTDHGGARVDFNKPVDDEASDLALELNGVFDTDKLARLVAFGQSRRFFDTVDELTTVLAESTSWAQSARLFNVVWFDYAEVPGDRSQLSINDRYFAWLNHYYNGVPLTTTELEVADPNKGYHDMRAVIPPQVLPDINGFNGKMRKRQPNESLLSRSNAYGSYVETYGTKWPGFEFEIGTTDTGQVYLDFDTAWSPPNETYFDQLSERIPQLEEIYYAEQGVGFCGGGLVLHPGTVFWRNAELQIAYEDQPNGDVIGEVISPEWIKGKVSNYGG